MSGDIELDDFSTTRPSRSTIPDPALALEIPVVISTDANDGVMSIWTFAAASLAFLSAILLTLAPRFLLFTSAATEEVEQRNVLTPLEAFLARHFGLYLYAVAAALVFNIPSASPVEQQQRGIHWHPLLAPLTAASTFGAFSAYNTDDIGSLSTLVFLADAFIGGFGLWAMAFAGSSYVSRKTGADKRTSRFLFGNKAAASSRKKKWKEEQRTKQ